MNIGKKLSKAAAVASVAGLAVIGGTTMAVAANGG